MNNIVNWFQEDLFSKKLGALLSNYALTHQGELSELLVLLIMAKQRPPGWEKEIERFIVRTKKNSYYLCKVFESLQTQMRIGFSTERTRQQLRRLSAMSLAKHSTGAKHPNIKLVKKVAKSLDQDMASENRGDCKIEP